MSAFTDPNGYRQGWDGDTRGASGTGYRTGALDRDSLDRAFKQGAYAPSATPSRPSVSSPGLTSFTGAGSGGRYYAGSRSYSEGGLQPNYQNNLLSSPVWLDPNDFAQR
jgi:hypothetical protein